MKARIKWVEERTFIGESGRWTNDLAAEQAVQGYLEAVGFKVPAFARD